jgi:hypothetical protein
MAKSFSRFRVHQHSGKIMSEKKSISKPRTTVVVERMHSIQPDFGSIENGMAQWIQDLEEIFKKAMDSKNLSVALKAKELLAKNQGWICRGAASTPHTIKTIDRWTLQEINDLIVQLDHYVDTKGCFEVANKSEKSKKESECKTE